MSIMTHLYLTAERGQTERLQEALGIEVSCATLFYESRVPKSERGLLNPDYAAAKQISVKFEGLMGTNFWERGNDGFWFVETN
jgi:hypothetical protein